MLVPAMAFAWWLVSFPSAAAVAAAAPPHAAVAQGAAEMQSRSDRQAASPAQGSGELVAVKVVTPDIVNAAEEYLGQVMRAHAPLGTQTEETIDGRRYVLRLERHYHPPGYKRGPNGWHKGITVYEVR